MTAASYDITVERGADKSIPITIQDSNQQGVDITGWVFTFTVKESYDDNSATLILDNGSNGGITITNATAGQLNIVITDTQTRGLTAKVYIYDLKATKPDGTDEYILVGELNVLDMAGA